MGKKAEFIFEEALIGSAFFGGVWAAIRLNPEKAIIQTLGEVIADLIGPAAANSYVTSAETLLFFGFIMVLLGVYAIGRKTGLAAFGVMWLAGYFLALGVNAGVFLLFMGWGLGALAVQLHTNERVGVPPNRGLSGM